jgi:hypothetical protein
MLSKLFRLLAAKRLFDMVRGRRAGGAPRRRRRV